MSQSALAYAHPNIAFIKYWGNQETRLRIPVNGSISMNLAGLETRTRVTFDGQVKNDQLIINDQPISGKGLKRVSLFMDQVRDLANIDAFAVVESENNFPIGAGIASSASAFAALSLAATRAAGIILEEADLSRLARLGSGSACRSIPAGFVEWQAGSSHQSSFATSFAGPNYWNIVDLIAVINRQHKLIGSSSGHLLAETSPIQNARVDDAERRLRLCRKAILNKDFLSFAEIVEQDCNLMHSVMLTSKPALLYWDPGTITVMKAVQLWREAGIAVCYTIDAGPNVHLICLEKDVNQVKDLIKELPDVKEILECQPGGSAALLDKNPPGV